MTVVLFAFSCLAVVWCFWWAERLRRQHRYGAMSAMLVLLVINFWFALGGW